MHGSPAIAKYVTILNGLPKTKPNKPMQNLAIPMPPRASYNREDWIRGYTSQPNEYGYWIEDIEGEIPNGLQGTLFRNGSGLLDVGESPLAHPFDGDGMVCRFSFFPNGKVYFHNRFVRTEGSLADQKAQKILYRGFATQKPGGWLANFLDLKLKNVANTSVLYWADRLWALWEAGQPHRLDPATLETLGCDRFLESVLQPGQPLSAHPRIIKDENTNEEILVTYGTRGALSSKLTIFEFDRRGKLLKQHAHSLAGFGFLHDMLVTSSTCIFINNSFVFDGLSFLLGLKGGEECLKFQRDRPTQIILVSRHDDFKMQIVETDPCFAFHHGNAWEEEGKIWFDSVGYDSFPQTQTGQDFRQNAPYLFPKGQLYRFCIDRDRQTVRSYLLEERGCEFPTINRDRCGRSYRYVYLGAAHAVDENAPLQAILKIDWQTGERQLWSVAPRGFVSEPIFVPAPDGREEDEGWLLVLVYDAAKHRSKLVILDARDLHRGAIAQLHLTHHIPHDFHGTWTSFLPELP